MSVLRATPDFMDWLTEHGFSERDLESPPVAWGLVALYEKSRDPEAAPIEDEEASSTLAPQNSTDVECAALNTEGPADG